MKEKYYIGDGINNRKSGANCGYVHKVENKEEKKKLKKKGYIFFNSFEHANNFRIAEILLG